MTIYASLSRPRHSGERRNPERTPENLLDSGVRRNDDYRVRSNDIPIQVSPLTVCGLDQIKLPRPTPVLDCFLTRNGRFHCLVRLEPDQGMNTVFLRKAFRKIILVLPNALNQIGSHADVERPIALAGEDIDAGLFHGGSVLDSGVATPRSGVQGMQSRRNDCSVIPGSTRNPWGAFDHRLDSGLRRNDGGGGLCRNSLPRTRSGHDRESP